MENFQEQRAAEMDELQKQVCLQQAYTAQLKAEAEGCPAPHDQA